MHSLCSETVLLRLYKFHPGVIVIGWSLEHIIIIIIFYRESRMGGDGEEEEWSTVHVSNIPPYTTRWAEPVIVQAFCFWKIATSLKNFTLVGITTDLKLFCWTVLVAVLKHFSRVYILYDIENHIFSKPPPPPPFGDHIFPPYIYLQ